MHLHAIWLENAIVIDNAKHAVKKAVEVLKESKVEFDTIAFSGMSGALFATPLAHRMNKEMILVRKSSDQRHSCHSVEGYQAAKRVLIVDDICASGTTVKHIIAGIRAHCNGPVKIVGAYFYGEGRGAWGSPVGFVEKIHINTEGLIPTIIDIEVSQ
jgi:adenine/guanine phosphoribosyltransferase-like PRPP-binding protein